MHNFFVRTLTALVIGAISLVAYQYCAPEQLACALLLLGLYVLIVEFIPLCKPYTPSIALSCTLFIIIPFSILIGWAYDASTHYLIALTVCMASSADIGAYCIGSLWGKHRLALHISPNKTWEGFFGGVCAASITTVLIYYLWGNTTFWKHIPQMVAFFIALGFGAAFSGLFGDLFISSLKRAAGVKDTGHLLPGHGGLLDRLDSILAVTLFVWLHKTTIALLFG
jgi:phosphatidate cytidylyltransferase